MFSAYGEDWMSTDQFGQKPLYKVLPSVRCDLVNVEEIIRAASETDDFKKQLNRGLNTLYMLYDKVEVQIEELQWTGDLAPRVYVALRAHDYLRSALRENSIETELLQPIHNFGGNIDKMDSLIGSMTDSLSISLGWLCQNCWQLSKDIQQYREEGVRDEDLQCLLTNSTYLSEVILHQKVVLIVTGLLKDREEIDKVAIQLKQKNVTLE
jgi:hypothetical protein